MNGKFYVLGSKDTPLEDYSITFTYFDTVSRFFAEEAHRDTVIIFELLEQFENLEAGTFYDVTAAVARGAGCHIVREFVKAEPYSDGIEETHVDGRWTSYSVQSYASNYAGDRIHTEYYQQPSVSTQQFFKPDFQFDVFFKRFEGLDAIEKATRFLVKDVCLKGDWASLAALSSSTSCPFSEKSSFFHVKNKLVIYEKQGGENAMRWRRLNLAIMKTKPKTQPMKRAA